MTDCHVLLRNQLAIAWALTEYHLGELVAEDLHWAPCDVSWDVRLDRNVWRADWEDVEPQPIPVPTVAWLTWHIGWWWSTALGHLQRQPISDRQAIVWPGDVTSVVAWLRNIHSAWASALEEIADLDSPATYPWPDAAGFTRADMCAWVNIELTKNAAEIGQLRLLRHASLGP